MQMTLKTASLIVDTVLKIGREHKFMPLTCAVLDAGGHLVAFKREDDSSIMRFDIAFGKAWGSLAMGFGSRELLNRTEANPTFIAALVATSGGRMVPVPGGVLVLADGKVIGAVGVSGDNSNNDELCAVQALTEMGLDLKVGL
jgi:uncharacterized protein GlcG (DUF336 family)